MLPYAIPSGGSLPVPGMNALKKRLCLWMMEMMGCGARLGNAGPHLGNDDVQHPLPAVLLQRPFILPQGGREGQQPVLAHRWVDWAGSPSGMGARRTCQPNSMPMPRTCRDRPVSSVARMPHLAPITPARRLVTTPATSYSVNRMAVSNAWRGQCARRRHSPCAAGGAPIGCAHQLLPFRFF